MEANGIAALNAVDVWRELGLVDLSGGHCTGRSGLRAVLS